MKTSRRLVKTIQKLTEDSKDPLEQAKRLKLRERLDSQRKFLKNPPSKADRRKARGK